MPPPRFSTHLWDVGGPALLESGQGFQQGIPVKGVRVVKIVVKEWVTRKFGRQVFVKTVQGQTEDALVVLFG